MSPGEASVAAFDGKLDIIDWNPDQEKS